jgi:putative NADPH-quinone reductase
MGKKVVAVLGTYRKGGTLDAAVEAILEGARARLATTSTIYLTDKHLEYCTNCRTCTQAPGPGRGKCRQDDDLDAILEEIEAADAVVLASPVNCGNATAIFRCFMERLIGCAYWPWGQPAPKARSHIHTLKAALVATSAMPGFLIPLATGTKGALRTAARILGAKPVASLWIGLAAGEPDHKPSPRVLARARRIGRKLV